MKTFFDEKLTSRSLFAVAINVFEEENIFIREYFDVILSDKECDYWSDFPNDEVVAYLNQNIYMDKSPKYLLSDSVLNKINTFPLPKTLQDKLKNTIRYMDIQLLKWLKDIHDLLLLLPDPRVISPIKWTDKGKVDILKTITNIVNNEDVRVFDRLLLSCHFCFEDIVSLLWDKLEEGFKHDTLCKLYVHYPFWYSHLQGQTLTYPSSLNFERRLPNENIYIQRLYSCIVSNNVLAFKYFWNKLSSTAKMAYSISDEDKLKEDLILFLQSQPEICSETFLNDHEFSVLAVSLTNWLWQDDLGLELKSYQSTLSDYEFRDLIFIGVIDILEVYPVKDKLRYLVTLIWGMFSVKHRYLFKPLRRLLEINETQILLTLIKDLPTEDIKMFLRSNENLKIDLMKEDQRLVLDELIRLCCKTEEEVDEFKRDYLLIGSGDRIYESDDSF